MASATFIAAVGQHLVRQIVEEGAVPASRTHVTCMGVELAPLVSLGAEREFRSGALHVVTVARLNIMKGHIHALAAVRRAVDAGVDIRYTIAGAGEHRGAIEARVAELGLGDRVRLVGTLSESEVFRLLGEADAFVLPSIGAGEAWPVSVMEAMAAGLPVISSVIGATPQMIESGVDGILVEQGDEPALAEALLRLARDVAARRAMGERARVTARERFDVAHHRRTAVRGRARHTLPQRRANIRPLGPGAGVANRLITFSGEAHLRPILWRGAIGEAGGVGPGAVLADSPPYVEYRPAHVREAPEQLEVETLHPRIGGDVDEKVADRRVAIVVEVRPAFVGVQVQTVTIGEPSEGAEPGGDGAQGVRMVASAGRSPARTPATSPSSNWRKACSSANALPRASQPLITLAFSSACSRPLKYPVMAMASMPRWQGSWPIATQRGQSSDAVATSNHPVCGAIRQRTRPLSAGALKTSFQIRQIVDARAPMNCSHPDRSPGQSFSASSRA